MNIKNILVIFTIVIGIPVLVASNYEVIKNLFSTEYQFIEASKKLDVKEERLSAINSLRKIVSKDEDYVPKVMEILCKYVQRRAPIPKDPGYDNTNPEADVQRALTVIGENNKSFYKKGKKCHLSRTNLIRAKLIRANLTGADLERSNLSRADLTGADLTGADLTGTDLTGADLTGANLFKAGLIGTDLTGADLQDTDLRRIDLIGADLRRADLRRADLRRADLERSNLFGADLILVSNFSCTRLKKAKNWDKAYRSSDLKCDADIPVRR